MNEVLKFHDHTEGFTRGQVSNVLRLLNLESISLREPQVEALRNIVEKKKDVLVCFAHWILPKLVEGFSRDCRDSCRWRQTGMFWVSWLYAAS